MWAGGENGVSGQGEEDDAWERHFQPSPLCLEDMERAHQVEALLRPLSLRGATLLRVRAVFEREAAAGLAGQPSSLQMDNTYVPALPDGTEEGLFLALDLGGTNFRVLLLELSQGQLVREIVRHYHISDELRLGEGQELFEFLAECVHEFLRAEGMEHEDLALGFTFSFPMRLHSISSGELVTWTKSFKCGGMSGVDVAALLQSCLARRGLAVTVRVLLNDTTGTLVAGAHNDARCGIGVILGTGSNGCYMERAECVSHWECEGGAGSGGDVAVDVEWGAFGDNGCLDFLRTEYDEEVDRNSLLATSFTFEKYIGGKYLGCVLRAALAALARAGLFPGEPERQALHAAHLTQFEEEHAAGECARTAAALRGACGPSAQAQAQGVGAVVVGADDARVAQYAAQLISTRAAQLAAVCVSALLRRMRRAHVSVAVDGSVYKRHPRIRHLMRTYIQLLAPGQQFALLDAEDGSGKGAALTAAIAARILRAHTAAAAAAAASDTDS